MPSRQSSAKVSSAAAASCFGDGGEHGGDAPVPGEARGLQHRVLVYDGRAGALVEQGDGVAHAAVGEPRQQLGGLVRELEALLGGDVVEVPGDDLRVQAAEAVALAAREDRRGHLAQLGGGEDEHQVLRRLLEYLEQGVEGRDAEHVDLVDDVDALFDAGGGEDGLVAQGADVVHAVVGGGVYLHDVHDGAVVDAAAGGALTAGVAVHGVLAVHGLGEYLGAAGLARAARAYEEVGVRKPAGGDLGLQRLGDLLLTADLVKGAGAVFAV